MPDGKADAELLATVVHDLKSPLNAIVMSATLLSRTSQDESVLRQVGVIQRSADRMSRLILDLLDQAAIDSGRLSIRPARHAASDLVREAIENIQPLAAQKMQHIAIIHCDPCWAMADRERIQQILVNLLSNAVRFTPAGGRIGLAVRPLAGEIELSVSDTGRGIPAEDLPHVFERFWRGSGGDRTNTGLGLSIARGIVEAHGGRITVESTPGEGTTFRFTLPGGVEERAELERGPQP